MPQLFIFLVIAVAVAAFCYVTAQKKGRNPIPFALLGFFLPLIGLIVVLVIKKQEPQSI